MPAVGHGDGVRSCSGRLLGLPPWWCSGSGPPGTARSSGLTLHAAGDHAGLAFTGTPRCCSFAG